MCYFTSYLFVLMLMNIVSDTKVVTVALEGLENMLKVGQATNKLDRIVEIINECNGVTAIENLQNHNNKQIYLRAVKVRSCYGITK